MPRLPIYPAIVAALAATTLVGCGPDEKAGAAAGNGQAGSGEEAAGPEAAAPAAPSASAGNGPSLASAPASFGQCAACHSLQPGKHGIGPSLAGIYGTTAGEIPDYNFSAPLKASGLVWDDATLDKWLEAPMQMVPGTKMTYGGLKDPAKRAELIAFIKTLK